MTLNTILSSTNSGRTGFFDIGKEITTYSQNYTIRSAFQPEYPNGSKPTLLICTYEFAKSENQRRKYSFVILHKYPNQQYTGYGNIEGTTAYCEKILSGKCGYELKTNLGKFQVVHEFWFNGKHCFVGTLKKYTFGYLDVYWKNEYNGRYYKVMYKNENLS